MTKFLPDELRDLSTSKRRVMSNVEQQLNKRARKSKPIVYGAAFVLAAALLTFGLTQLPTTEELEPAITVTEGQYDTLLKSYVGKNNSHKTYSSGRKIFTQWLSNHYFKETIFSDDGDEVLYYRLANNRIDFLTQSSVEEQLTVEQLATLPAQFTLLSAPFEQKELAQEDVSNFYITDQYSLYGSYENVLRVENNASGGYRRVSLYAQNVGLIEASMYKGEELMTIDQLISISESSDKPVAMSFRKSEDTSLAATFHTPWLYSPNGSQRIILEGRGEFGGEEGEGVLILEQTDGTKRTAYGLMNTGKPIGQWTPKKLAWIDEERLFVTIGMAHGMVTQGGELFIFNIDDGSLTPVLVDLPSLEEISDIRRIDDTTFEYERFVYKTSDMDYNESYTEVGKIEIIEATVTSINHKVVNIIDPNLNEQREISIDLQHDTLALNEIEPNTTYELLIIGDFVHSIK